MAVFSAADSCAWYVVFPDDMGSERQIYNLYDTNFLLERGHGNRLVCKKYGLHGEKSKRKFLKLKKRRQHLSPFFIICQKIFFPCNFLLKPIGCSRISEMTANLYSDQNFICPFFLKIICTFKKCLTMRCISPWPAFLFIRIFPILRR